MGRDITVEGRAITTKVHEEAARAGHLPLWAVYGPGTSDLPGLYVARLFLADQATPVRVTAHSLDELLERIPEGLVRISRSDRDDPNIIETWVTPDLYEQLRTGNLLPD